MKSMVRFVCMSVVAGSLVAGCAASQRHAEIPVSAQVVAEGNNRISYQAPRDGMVWVYNQGNGNMEYAGRVSRGDSLVVDPSMDKITLNDKNVNNKPLTSLDQKRIFFEPEAITASDRRIERVYEERRIESVPAR